MRKRLLLFIFILTASLSFSQEKNLTRVWVSPNPFYAETAFHINAKANETIILTVKNVLGKTVFNKSYRVASGKNEISFQKNNLKAGMYIYAIQSKNQVVSKRFVIK